MLNRNLIILFVFILTWNIAGASADGDAARGRSLAIICADCHGDDGLGDEDVPTIAGMDAADIRKQLSDFKSGARIDEYEDMVDTAADLSEQDMADLAAYFSTLAGK